MPPIGPALEIYQAWQARCRPHTTSTGGFKHTPVVPQEKQEEAAGDRKVWTYVDSCMWS